MRADQGKRQLYDLCLAKIPSGRKSQVSTVRSRVIPQNQFAGLNPLKLKENVIWARHTIRSTRSCFSRSPPSSLLFSAGCSILNFRLAQRSLTLRPARLQSRLYDPLPPEASAALLPPPLLRLLPGGTNQFPGGTRTHCGLNAFSRRTRTISVTPFLRAPRKCQAPGARDRFRLSTNRTTIHVFDS